MNIYAEDGYEALRVGCTANNNCEGENPDSGVTTQPPASPAGAIAAVIIVLLVLSAAPVAAFFVWQKLKKPAGAGGNSMQSKTTYGSTSM